MYVGRCGVVGTSLCFILCNIPTLWRRSHIKMLCSLYTSLCRFVLCKCCIYICPTHKSHDRHGMRFLLNCLLLFVVCVAAMLFIYLCLQWNGSYGEGRPPIAKFNEPKWERGFGYNCTGYDCLLYGPKLLVCPILSWGVWVPRSQQSKFVFSAIGKAQRNIKYWLFIINWIYSIFKVRVFISHIRIVNGKIFHRL